MATLIGASTEASDRSYRLVSAGISHGLQFPRNDYHWRRMGTLSTKTGRPPDTAYDDGTTHVILSPMEFMGRLAALVPRPRMK